VAELLVVGSVALDSVETPFGKVHDALGGSATYFSYAASFFTEVRVVGAVGNDFPTEHLELLRNRGVDVTALEILPGQKTFRWTGEYGFDLNEARTLDVQLNAFAEFKPKLGPVHRKAPFLFLANIDPVLQLEVLEQMDKPALAALDTMNFWIEGKRADLLRVLGRVDVLLINDTEVKMLAGEKNLLRASRKVLTMGPQALVIKHGEYGATIFFREGAFGIGKHPFRAPALPIEEVKDPTGAGDSFAGGFIGYLAATNDLSDANMRRAVIFGSVMGSFAVEKFSIERLMTLTRAEIDQRMRDMRRLVAFEEALPA